MEGKKKRGNRAKEGMFDMRRINGKRAVGMKGKMVDVKEGISKRTGQKIKEAMKRRDEKTT